jgi:hypothetical protein
MRRCTLLAISVTAVTAIGVAACGGGTKPPTHHKPFKTPKFLQHASLAFGAFHRFVGTPAHSGVFSSSSSAVRTAARAAMFASGQLKQASVYAKQNQAERALFPALVVLADKMKSLSATILGPSSSLPEINAINESLNRLDAAASARGHHIPDASAAQIAAAGGPHA